MLGRMAERKRRPWCSPRRTGSGLPGANAAIPDLWFLRRNLDELDQEPVELSGVDEGDHRSHAAGSGLLVDQPHALVTQPAQVCVQIFDLEGDMVESRTPFSHEPLHDAGAGRLEGLDVGVAHGDHPLDKTGYILAVAHRHTQKLLKAIVGLRRIRVGERDVMDTEGDT